MAEIKDLASKYGIVSPAGVEPEQLIVLIEDQTDMRLIVAHQLSKLGFKNIKQFSDGHDAIAWLRAEKIQGALTICDDEMPVLGGFDLLGELKGDSELSRGPFAITIDNPSRSKIMLATESGVDGVLVKPYTLKDIMPKIKQAFKVYHNPANPELLYERAKQAIRANDLSTAESIYENLMLVAEKAARPLVGLAQLARQREEFGIAEDYLKQAEERNKNYVHIFVERGELYAQQGKIEEAVSQFSHAIHLSPLNPIRYEKAAVLLFKMNKHQEAVDLMSIALQNELSFPALHHYLSQGYYVLKDYKKAVRHIRSALNKEPENVVYLNQLGISYKESKESEAALKTYNQIIKLDPENKAALYNKAVLLKSTGKLDEAIKLMDRCLEKHPNFQAAKTKLQEYEAEKKAAKEQAS